MQMSLEAPFYFFIWPGEWFHYGPTSTWEESFLCFSGERVAEWQACGWLRQDPRVYPLNGPLDPVWQCHERILQLLGKGGGSNADLAKCLSGELMCLLHAGTVQDAAPLSQAERIQDVARSWREEPWREVILENTAAEVGLSYPHFRRVFRKLIGESPYQYLATQRIAYACGLLRSTDLSVKEVSAKAGFDYVESFNRLFRRLMDRSPTSYRESDQVLWGG